MSTILTSGSIAKPTAKNVQTQSEHLAGVKWARCMDRIDILLPMLDALRCNKMMVKRLYQTVAVTGALSLMNVPSAHSATVPSGRENTTPVLTEGSNRTTGNKLAKDGVAEQKNPPVSAFIAFSCLLVDNAFIPDNPADTRISAFDPVIVDRIVSAVAMGLATGHATSGNNGLPVKRLFNNPPLPSEKISIQPLAFRRDFPAFNKYAATLFPDSLVPSTDDRYALSQLPDVDTTSFKTVSGFKELPANAPNAAAKSGKLPLNYSYKKDRMSLNTGISWINDLSDSRGLSENFQKAGFEGTVDKVPGVNFNLGASYQAFSLSGGYIRSLDKYASAQPSYTGNETESDAWSSEIAYTTELLRKETVLAVGYQKSSESLRLYLPEQRYVTKASVAIFDGTTLSLEYYHDKDYSVKNGGSTGDGYGITTKIGFEFQTDR